MTMPTPPNVQELEEKNFEALHSDELIIHGADYFFNYELSWLDFNFRVLDEARNPANPPLEQAKFIGIVCSNLDEFFQKRVGGLKRQLEAGMDSLSVDGLTPAQQLTLIRKKVKQMITDYRGTFFDEIVPKLESEGIAFREYSSLRKKEKAKADEYFKTQLYPLLTPLIVDQGHPFPFISNKSRSFAVEILDPGSGETIFARIKVPENRPRWLQLNSTKADKAVLINIDDIIKEHIGELFPGGVVKSAHIFRVTRNADIKRQEEEADDLLELIEEELRERRFAEVVRIELDAQMPEHIRELLIKNLKISPSDIFEMEGLIGLADCLQLDKLSGFRHIRYNRWSPVTHPAFKSMGDEPAVDLFSVIRSSDVMVHHPYHSFTGSVERFIREAAADPSVLAIKQTLYRTSEDSPVMHALIKAAESGKQVAVLIELKARFDEQRNIEWAVKLEKAGIHVSYGLPGLKIHSKITVVVRDEGGNINRYAHIGTGNYHPGTANLYEDLGLFTCDPELAADVSDLFNFLTGYAPNQTYRKLLVAPHFLRSELAKLIDYEVKQAREGAKARIIMKMNSLEDPLLIQRLYYASSQGVEIDIIVRGVCRLKPGIKSLSERIRIHSVIGRFLEHSRIFYFNHSGTDLYYIGSADVMHRNLDSRVEAITPVENNSLKSYLGYLFSIYLKDNSQRWLLASDGTYSRAEPAPDENSKVASHHELMMHTIGKK
ncbi:MAG: polyphosphate kinase 1 [Balneolia bacterium]|nr:polyphosphate kinase 1 [Balneolia bacterium]